MHHTYRWHSLEGEGWEYLDLFVDEAILAQGTITGPALLTYSVRCDAQWRVRELRVERPGATAVHLTADGNGCWRDAAGAEVPALAGCIDVDIAGCAFTNTLPIRRLGAQLAQRTLIQVAYVDVPSLHVHPAGQAYMQTAPRHYLYEGPIGGFRADLTVDGDGLVLHYPGLFERVS